MEKKVKTYAPPKGKIYQFDNNDSILTESGVTNPVADYSESRTGEEYYASDRESSFKKGEWECGADATFGREYRF